MIPLPTVTAGLEKAESDVGAAAPGWKASSPPDLGFCDFVENNAFSGTLQRIQSQTENLLLAKQVKPLKSVFDVPSCPFYY